MRRKHEVQECVPVMLSDLISPRVPASRSTRKILYLAARGDGQMVYQGFLRLGENIRWSHREITCRGGKMVRYGGRLSL